MARPTWADIKQEALLELRNRSDISTRLEGWIRDAYIFLCVSRRIHEMEKTLNFKLTTNLSEIAFAKIVGTDGDGNAVSGLVDLKHTLSLRDVTSSRRLKHAGFRYIDSRPTATGFPRNYCRYSSSYLFDSAPAQEVSLKLRYRKQITEPVFVNQATPKVVNYYPETPPEWDEPIRLLGVYRGFCALFEEDMGQVFLQKAQALIGSIPTEEAVEADDDDWGVQVRVEWPYQIR